MYKCPVCSKESDNMLCVECGFDRSQNYEMYSTLCMVKTTALSAQKAEYERKHKHYFRCDGCNSSQFHLDWTQFQQICCQCGKVHAMPKLAAVQPVPKKEVPTPAKTQTTTPQAEPRRKFTVPKRNLDQVIAFGRWGAVAVKNDGHLLVQPRKQWDMADGTFYLSRQDLRDLSSWDNIVSVISNENYLMALNSYGHVKVMGTSKFGLLAYEKFYSYSWKVIAIAGSKDHAVGLKSDGKVEATGWNAHGQCNVSDWRDIVSVAAGSTHTIGLKADGTVVATGQNNDGQCNVSHWENIIAISAAGNLTIGLKADGSVTAAGNLTWMPQVYSWSNITQIHAGADLVLGLKSDGTCVCTGTYPSDNRNIAAIAADGRYAVTVKKDGTLTTSGKDKLHKVIAKWKDIKVPT